MPGSPIVVDAAGDENISIDVTLSSPVAITNPVGGKQGQKLLFRLTQGGRGHNHVMWDDAYDFSGDLARPVLKSEAGGTDLLGFTYDAATGKWRYVARGDHYENMKPARAWAAAGK